MKKNRYLSWLVIAMFMFCSVFTFAPQGALAAQFTDVDNHWAASQIKAMVDQGVATGYPDNTFKPDAQVTRAEFVTLVNKAFQFTATADINYPDVKASDWFAPEIGKAKAAGYLGGYSDGTIKPANKLSRQEAAVIIAKALKLDASGTEAVSKFQDLSSIPDWSKGSIAALVSKAYMGGYPDGTFKPAKTITRAEAVVILANAKGAVVVTPTQPSTPAPTVEITKLDKAGTYGPATGNQAVKGNVTISTAGVNLQNKTISGDLLIAEGVGNGDVSLKNITVKGTTTIKGGGPNTVKVDNCVLNKVVINKSDGNIRVLLSGSTTISELVADSAVKVAGQATITKATVNKANVVIEAKPGSFTLASGITATINGKSETGATSTSSSGGGGGGGNSSGTSNVVAAVTASPASGTAVTAGSSVYLYTATEGATIYYTTDGITSPTTSSYCYSNSGIQITKATTIQAIAVKSGLTTSVINTFIYTIASPELISNAKAEFDGVLMTTLTATLASTVTTVEVYKGTNKIASYTGAQLSAPFCKTFMGAAVSDQLKVKVLAGTTSKEYSVTVVAASGPVDPGVLLTNQKAEFDGVLMTTLTGTLANTVTKVEVYKGANKLASYTADQLNAPFSRTFMGAAVGDQLTLKAFAGTASKDYSVTVAATADQNPPEPAVLVSNQQAAFDGVLMTTLTATLHNTVTKFEIYNGAKLLATYTGAQLSAPFSKTFMGAAVGNQLTLKAYVNASATDYSVIVK